MNRRLGFLLGGLVVCLLLAGVVSTVASSDPDGLEHAAREGCTEDEAGEVVNGSCMAQAEREHDLSDAPFADYGVSGLASDAIGTGVAGVLGVLVTFALTGGLFWLVRRRGAAAAPGGGAAGEPPPPERPTADRG